MTLFKLYVQVGNRWEHRKTFKDFGIAEAYGKHSKLVYKIEKV